MTQMFRNVRFPDAYAYGADGGVEFATDLFLSPGGWESRLGHWPVRRGRWTVSFVNRSQAAIAPLLHFFRAVGVGRGYSFRFRDFTDYQFNNPFALGDGSASTFQLTKRYAYGDLTLYVPITKPVAASMIVAINAVQTSAWTVEETTGLLTFATPPASGAVLAAAGEFDRMVRFGADTLPLTCVAPGVFRSATIELVEVVDEELDSGG